MKKIKSIVKNSLFRIGTLVVILNARINCVQDDDLVEKEIYYIILYA